jgi:hypothetical protein
MGRKIIMTKIGLKALKTKLVKKFPHMWIKDGHEFDSGYAKTLWTGEGSDIDGIPAFDHYNYEFYIMGIHPKLEEFLGKLGYHCEWYDGGTVFIYKN